MTQELMFRFGACDAPKDTAETIAEIVDSAGYGINAPSGQIEAERARVDKLRDIVALLVAELPDAGRRRIVAATSWRAEEVSPE